MSSLKQDFSYQDEVGVDNVQSLTGIFDKIDVMVNTFSEQFQGKWLDSITAEIFDRQLTLTPLQVFTHVITHEFHHKGQMMSICRLFGKTPLDTDVIRF